MFASLVCLPDVVVAAGQYLTRAGEVVTIEGASTRQDFGCTGRYPSGVTEGWHKSGRILFGCETANDIVSALV